MGNLITSTEYKTYAGISGTALDAQLAVLIPAMATQLRRACGRNLTNGFESATRTEAYSGDDADALQLREWPITSITSVSLLDSDGDSQAYETSDYRVDSDTGVLYRLDSAPSRAVVDTSFDPSARYFGPYPVWPRGFNNISIVYVGGYSTIPDDLKYAMYRLVDIAVAAVRSDPSKMSESLGAYSYQRATNEERDAVFVSIIAAFQTMES